MSLKREINDQQTENNVTNSFWFLFRRITMIVVCYRFISQINSSFRIQSFIGDQSSSSSTHCLHLNAQITPQSHSKWHFAVGRRSLGPVIIIRIDDAAGCMHNSPFLG